MPMFWYGNTLYWAGSCSNDVFCLLLPSESAPLRAVPTPEFAGHLWSGLVGYQTHGFPSMLLGGIPTHLTHLKNMSSSIGMMTFPIYDNIWKNNPVMLQTTNQNTYIYIYIIHRLSIDSCSSHQQPAMCRSVKKELHPLVDHQFPRSSPSTMWVRRA